MNTWVRFSPPAQEPRVDTKVEALANRLANAIEQGSLPPGSRLRSVRDAAASIKPGALTWVVVGELAKIEQPIRDLKLGAVHVMDADGKKLR